VLVAYAGGLVALENPPKDDAIPKRVPANQVPAGSSGVIAAGADPTCALVNRGVQCWGNNGNCQLGSNSTPDNHVPVSVSGWGP
jgi:hypothetical protein